MPEHVEHGTSPRSASEVYSLCAIFVFQKVSACPESLRSLLLKGKINWLKPPDSSQSFRREMLETGNISEERR